MCQYMRSAACVRSLFNRTLGRKINSTTLLATSEDSRNDIITTAAVLLAAVIEAVRRV